ncbi:MAG: alpha/beta hydrolase [Lysobacteraceae bacterium]|nr:MAG: alpha/beta hydrolase [Xanthomonadaceae bacterium]
MERSRIIRTGVAVLLVLGYIGYREYRERQAQPAAANEAPAATAADDAPPAEPVKFGSIAFEPCTLAPQFGPSSVEAQCGTLAVPENPAQPDGRKLELAIAWVQPGDEAEIEPDPVFMLAGGPGQSARRTFPQVSPAFAKVLEHRHVILVDQRGTGASNPLDCDFGDDEEAIATAAGMRVLTERCRDALAKKADLRFYTTTDAVRDLDAVRQALGVDQVNLLGISYGTRVAQQYAMRHPGHTRSLVLDSVVPNELILGNDFAANLERALDLQFAQCEQSQACTSKLGHPRAQLDALMATLRAQPPLVRYRDAATGESKAELLRPEAVAALMRMYAYMPMVSALLPLQLHEAAQGRYDGLMALTRMLGESIGDQMAMGMQLSVVCSEDAAGFRADPSAEGTLLGNQFAEFLGEQCEAWPRGDMPADFHQPLSGEVPVLVLEGEFDPVTPPRYGEQVVANLPNARLLVLKGQGHNVIGAGCMPKLFAQFIATTDAKGLDAKCLDDLAYVPPFTSFNGWEP